MDDATAISPHEKLKINISVGQAAHASHLTLLQGRQDEAWKMAALILTTLATLNSGPLIAMLALAGSMLSGKVTVPPDTIVRPVVWFSLGLGADLLAMFTGFFAITSYIDSLSKTEFRFEHPYVVERETAATPKKWGNGFRGVAILFAVASFVCAGRGAYVFIDFAKNALRSAVTVGSPNPKPAAETKKTPPAGANKA